MKNFTTRLQRDITTNHPIFLTNRSKLWVFVKICKKSLGADRLPNLHCGGSIESTTKHNGGYRSRNTSGIFLSQIHLSQGIKIFFTPSKAVFVARATLRNKAGNRTNKGGYHPLWLVVEPLPRLLSVSKLSLNNITENFTMLFKFLLLGEKRLTVRIRAKSEAEDCMKQQARLYKTAQNLVQNDNLLITEQKTILHPLAKIGYSADVVAKSTAERGNSNNLQVANDSTPLTRAFFVRSIRTPKENALSVLLSMVGRNGQRLIVGCLPLVAVFHPVTLYRQAWKLAVDSQKSTSGVVQMFYKFLFTGSRLRITVFANNLAEAYKRLPLSQTKPVLIARLPVQGGIYA